LVGKAHPTIKNICNARVKRNDEKSLVQKDITYPAMSGILILPVQRLMGDIYGKFFYENYMKLDFIEVKNETAAAFKKKSSI